MSYERSTWVYALTALPKEVVSNVVDALLKNYTIKPKALPQSGLGMLQLEDTAFHEPYFLGEFPVSTAWVELSCDDGSLIEGAAQVMDDDQNFANQLAVADAILASQSIGFEKIESLVDQGMSQREKEQEIRKAMLVKTAVDFSLLSTVEDDDE